tara:strand:- start:788 stop:1018 length:231 start_codon:yes stop_codon:yes gene_type:complete
MDLKVVLKGTEGTEDELIFAPFLEGKDRETLIDVVADLRADGKRVVCALSGSEQPSNLCTLTLLLKDDQWVVSEIV